MMMMKVGVIREERRSEMVKDKTCHKSDDNAEFFTPQNLWSCATEVSASGGGTFTV